MVKLSGFVGLVCLLTCVAVCAPAVPSPAKDEQPPPAGESSGSRMLVHLGTSWFRHRSPPALSLRFSANGKLLASAHDDQLIRLWDPATGNEIGRLVGHTGIPGAVALAPDGKRAASVGFRDKAVHVWDTGTSTEVLLLQGHLGDVEDVTFSPDGKKIASVAIHGEVCLWDASSGKMLHSFNAHDRDMTHIRFAPDGKEFATCNADHMVRRWETATGRMIAEFHAYPNEVSSIAYSPDGKLLATGSATGLVTTWNLATGKAIRQIKMGTTWVFAVAFTEDMKSVAVGGQGDVGLQLIDLATGKTGRFDLGSNNKYATVLDVALAPGGKYLVAAGDFDSLLRFDPATLKPVDPPVDQHQGPVSCISIVPDGNAIAWGGPATNTLRISELPGGKPLPGLKEEGSGIRSIARSPDGKLLAIVTVNDDLVHLRDAAGKPVDKFNKQKRTANQVVFTRDGKHLQGLCNDGNVRSWECSSGKETASASLPSASFELVVLSPNGTRLAAFDQQGKLPCIYSLPDVQQLAQLKGRKSAPFAAAFSPDGHLLATGHADGFVHLWNADTGIELGGWKVTDHALRALAFSPDGRTLATGSGHPDVVQLYELCTQRLRATLQGHSQPVCAVAFSPDGRLLASGSLDETCAIWDLPGRRSAGLPESVKLSETEIDLSWDNLLKDDPAAAWRDGWTLAAGGEAVVAFLKERLTPEEKFTADRVAQLIANLDSDEFDVRDRASRQLMRFGKPTADALRKTLAGNPSLEVHRRIDEILDYLIQLGAFPKGESLRHLRAVEVLERIGTPEARRLLEKLATGFEDDTLTREAKASLERLAGRK
jgi:WD40 repeat protein